MFAMTMVMVIGATVVSVLCNVNVYLTTDLVLFHSLYLLRSLVRSPAGIFIDGMQCISVEKLFMINLRDEPIKQVRKDDKTCLSQILIHRIVLGFFSFTLSQSLSFIHPLIYLSQSFALCMKVYVVSYNH